MKPVHPNEALFRGEKPFPVIPSCEHFAGSEKLIVKALELQDRLGPIFDITCDCEDGAQAGKEKEHAEMVVRVLGSPANKLRMAGVRIHDYTHPAWKQDVDVVVSGAGGVLAYVTIPKATSAAQVAEMIGHVEQVAARHGVRRQIPIHALVETHGALHDAAEIARLPGMQVLDFGLMDFVSGHHGAIPAAAMRSPGQFEHRLLARAKTEVVAAALAHGVIPAHNVTLDLKNAYQTYQRRLARAPRVRVPAHVVDLPGPDPADRGRDEAGLLGGAGRGGDPPRRPGGRVGADPVRRRAA